MFSFLSSISGAMDADLPMYELTALIALVCPNAGLKLEMYWQQQSLGFTYFD
jgi:hypothetical protein